jgi:Peptidase M30.
MLLALSLFLPGNSGDKAYAQSPSANVLISNESTNGGGLAIVKASNIKKNESAKTSVDYVKPFKMPSQEAISRKSSLLTGTSSKPYFYVFNMVTNKYYTIYPTRLYSGTKVIVWGNDSRFNAADAKKIGIEFEKNIYPLDTEYFGNPPDVSGKINILCFNILDGATTAGDAFEAGYFDPQDLFDVPYSNRTDIFYIDTNPLMGTGATLDVSQAYTTLAHEFQHMINFNQKVFAQGNYPMDTWMDEGLAVSAEHLYHPSDQADQIAEYNTDPDVANGHSLLYWDYNGDMLANYSLSYLFMQYFRIQSGQNNKIFKALINDPHSNYLAVQDLIHKYIDPKMSFGKFMTDFRIALYLNRKTGRYGFHDDPYFQKIVRRSFTGSSLSLRGGGAVVKYMKLASIPKKPQSGLTYTNLSSGYLYDSSAPAVPQTDIVADNDSRINGTAEKNSVIRVDTNGKQIGIGDADIKGKYQISIPKQRAGTMLSVSATDTAGNVSGMKLLYVIQASKPLRTAQVSIVNHRSGQTDTIHVTGLQSGDVIRLYDTHWHFMKTQKASGRTMTIFVHQLGTLEGRVYLSVTDPGQGESYWTRVLFKGESSSLLRSSQIRIYNYKYQYDQIRIYGIKKGDYIKVYNSRKKLIAHKLSGGYSTILYIKQLGTGAGHVSITITHYHMSESGKKYVMYGTQG